MFHYWRGTRQVSEPYEAYVPHRVAGWTPRPDPQTLDRLSAASDLLRAWGPGLQRSPALKWCLNRVEGIASSDVEGIRTTLRSLSLLESLRAARDPGRTRSDRQALGNVRLNAYAVAVGQRRKEPVTVADVMEMHRRLFGATAQDFNPGTLRTEQNWIGWQGHRTPAQADFVPPPPELAEPLLDDLMAYVSAPVWGHPVAKAALAHVQFETIHPFDDGNGRVGRALIHTSLHRDIGLGVALPLSAAIAASRDDYYESLRPYQSYIGDTDTPQRSAALGAAIDFIADAIAVACHYAQAVAAVVADMEQSWADLGLRPDSAAAAILERMATVPAATTGYLAEATGHSPRAIRRAVVDLAARGALAETNDEDTGRRVFELPEMLHIVDERQELLADCWELHASGTQEVVPEALQRFHSTIPPAQQAPSNPGC